MMGACLDLVDQAIWRIDPAEFAIGALKWTPDAWQLKALRSTARQSLWNCSRQAGKSTTAAALSLHTAIFQPSSLVLVACPSERQSQELIRKVKDHRKQMADPPKFVEENKSSVELANGSRIVALPGKEATIRGYSAPALVIEDESSRCPDELYAALRPMLAISHGRLMLMSTPYGRQGHFFEEWEHGGPNWERIEIRAIDCPRITREFLASERESLPERMFAQEYLCEFRDTIDQVFSYDQVMAAMSDDVEPLFGAPEKIRAFA